MTTAQVNYLNNGLMLVALILVFILPFELFLFSYAILGPLHYLTEISWLHDRQYFSPKKYDYIPLLLLSLLFFLGTDIPSTQFQYYLNLLAFADKGLFELLAEWSYALIFLAFGLALLFVITTHSKTRYFGLLGWIILIIFLDPGNQPSAKFNSGIWRLFAIYLPTLIHVYLFTGAFMLYGALKNKGKSGYFSFMLFLGCGIASITLPQIFTDYQPSLWAQQSYDKNFSGLSIIALQDIMAVDNVWEINLFSDPSSIKLLRFIAFAYTYHYLNWFSKTSIIQWHKIPKLRFLLIILLWAASIALYLYSYKLGFSWLFLLSFTHVLLEFPLNHLTFIGITKEIGKKASRA